MDDKNPASMHEQLNAESRERYARQILLPEVGETGQKELFTKKVLIVGAGGLGTPCSLYLAGAGVGEIDLVDSDVVALSNLPRQVMYRMDDIGKPKALLLAERLMAANPGVKVNPIVKRLDKDNIKEVVQGHDVVAACLDNLATRYILNEACVEAGIPMVEAAVSGFTGMVTVVMPGKGPCYQCLFPKRSTASKKPSSPPPIAGPAPGIAGALEASEVLKLLLNIGEPLVGRMLLFDLKMGQFQIVTASRREDCEICGGM